MMTQDSNARIKALTTQWQAAFHDVFDAHPPAENDGPRPNQMGDLGCDFRLLTGFSRLTPKARAQCLAHLPHAGAVTAAVETWLRPAQVISEADAQARLGEAAKKLMVALDMPKAPPGEVWFELGDRLPELAQANGGADAMAAVLFLTELMYWQGSSYTGAHFVCWEAAQPGQDNPVAPFVRIEKGGWAIGVDGDDLLLRPLRRDG